MIRHIIKYHNDSDNKWWLMDKNEEYEVGYPKLRFYRIGHPERKLHRGWHSDYKGHSRDYYDCYDNRKEVSVYWYDDSFDEQYCDYCGGRYLVSALNYLYGNVGCDDCYDQMFEVVNSE